MLAGRLHGQGIEIGALHRPLAVPATAHVTYVDHLSEEGLRQHYPELAEEHFAPVTVLGSAEDLSAFKDESLDFVIANHLLEHLEDPISGLREFHRVLRPGGVLYLALPDPRVSFDHDRPLTTVEHLLEEHRSGPEVNRRSHYEEYAANVDKAPSPARRADELMARNYSIHFHVWRPETFLEFLFAAEQTAGLQFGLGAFAAPEHKEDDEYIFLLLKGRDAVLPPASRTASAEPQAVKIPWRSRVAQSPIGPLLRPGYRLVRGLGPRLRRGRCP